MKNINYRQEAKEFRRSMQRFFTSIEYKSSNQNIFHCCVHKTGSQWFRNLFSEPSFYKYCGLASFVYYRSWPNRQDPRPILQRSFNKPFPQNTIISPLYIDYKNFKNIPKPENSKAFFIVRDPRNLVTSWFYSVKYTHSTIGKIGEYREELLKLNDEKGLIFAINQMQEIGIFSALDSWANAETDNTRVKIVKFEDIFGPNQLTHCQELLSFCDIQVPQETLVQLLEKYSFQRLKSKAKNRKNKYGHYRRGVSSEWKEMFSANVEAEFQTITKDLSHKLGYKN